MGPFLLMNTSTLCEIAQSTGTDKLGFYTPLYDLILQGRDIKKVLEIGIGTTQCMTHVPNYRPGASLRMWEQFFPKAEIFGVDIEPSVLVNEGRIRSQECDQSKRSDLIMAAQWTGGNLDLVIDDGSHKSEHQVLSVVTLMPFLSPDGIYIIEDSSRNIGEYLPFKFFEIHGSTGGRLILIRKQ
jgi:hypothetical protein